MLARVQAHGGHLDQHGMHARSHHGLQEQLLGLVPHVGQGHQAQTMTHLPGRQVQLSGAQQSEKHRGAEQSACTQVGRQAGATVSWTATLEALQERPHQESAQAPCMLRGEWSLQAGCDVQNSSFRQALQ